MSRLMIVSRIFSITTGWIYGPRAWAGEPKSIFRMHFSPMTIYKRRDELFVFLITGPLSTVGARKKFQLFFKGNYKIFYLAK